MEIIALVVGILGGAVLGVVGRWLWDYAKRDRIRCDDAFDRSRDLDTKFLLEHELDANASEGATASSPYEGPDGGSQAGSALKPIDESIQTFGDTLRLSQRVILHIYMQGRLSPGEIAPFDLCQRGMTERLSVSQGSLTKSLQRLRVAGVVVDDRRHVAGMQRRLKVYRLSPLGETLARDLRRRGLGAG